MGVGGQRYALAALPPAKTRLPLYRRLGGPHGRSGRVRQISPPPGFDPHVNANYLNIIFLQTAYSSVPSDVREPCFDYSWYMYDLSKWRLCTLLRSEWCYSVTL